MKLTPKEKAKELFSKYQNIYITEDSMGIDDELAKQCASIAVDEIILLDNYIDETILILFSKYPNIKVKIYTLTITKQLKLDFAKYQTQYKNIELFEFKNSHDRFLIIDKKEVYHLGASLKDLGKKWFAFSKFEIENLKILEYLK